MPNDDHRKSKPLLGVLGGMGTQATACFYDILHNMQNVTSEQEYLDVLLYSMPSIPDRTAFITGRSVESPLVPMLLAAKALEAAGASLLTMLCVTSHFFYDDLAGAVDIPFLSIPAITAKLAHERGIGKIGILATDGTLKGKVLHRAFERYGIEALVPPEDAQTGLMTMIYNIKRGVSVAPEELSVFVRELCAKGSDAVVLGCTELCIITGGSPDGSLDGSPDGSLDGNPDGSLDSNSDGSPDSNSDGSPDGSLDGSLDGSSDGSPDVINTLEVLAAASLSAAREQQV